MQFAFDGEICWTDSVNQTLIDQIVANVLAQLQSGPARPVAQQVRSEATVPATQVSAAVVTADASGESKPVELFVPIITADLLESSVRSGQKVRIGRTSILTPSARDWLQSKRTAWTRNERNGGSTTTSSVGHARWQIILQTVTPSVRALHDGLRRLPEGCKIELVGQPSEAVTLATNQIATAECDGVVIFTEQAELIACKANRHERVRAAVIQNSKQWEHVVRTLGANVVCISPVGRTFIELRNLLRDCAAIKPAVPVEW